MRSFFFQRVLSSKSFYFIIVVGIAISVLQIYQEAHFFSNDLRYNYGVQFTPYQSWIEFGISSSYRYLLFLLLPIIAAIPFADLYAKDQQTGYLKAILSKGKMKQYFKGLYITNFIVAGSVIVIPLLVNIYFAFITLPNIKPDPIVDGLPLDELNSFFPSLYYSFPFIHMLFYVLLAFLFAGMYATICLSVSLFVKSRFFILVSAFVMNMALTLILEFTNNFGWIPANFLTQHSGSPFISFSVLIIIFTLGMALSTFMYILGVRKRVIY